MIEPDKVEETSAPQRSVRHPQLQKGDAIVATRQIVNDGSVPHADENEIFANEGTMGMLVNIGYFEDNPDEELFLVCFQMDNGELGPPVTCLADEIAPLPQTQH